MIDEKTADNISITRLKDEHAAQINSMNKEFEDVKALFTNLVWNEVTKLQHQNEKLIAINEEEKCATKTEAEKNFQARIEWLEQENERLEMEREDQVGSCLAKIGHLERTFDDIN